MNSNGLRNMIRDVVRALEYCSVLCFSLLRMPAGLPGIDGKTWNVTLHAITAIHAVCCKCSSSRVVVKVLIQDAFWAA